MVADFAVRRGIPGGLVPDANRQVRWTIRGDGDGNDVDFVCREIPMYMATFIKARVCPLPAAGTAQFTAEMMRANYHCRGTAGGTLSIDDEGVVFAHFIFGTPLLSGETLDQDIDDFAEMVRRWRRLAGEYEKVYSDEHEPAVPPSDDDIWLGLTGFITV